MGPTKAEEIVRSGILTIEQLRSNPAILTSRQRLCLSLYEDLKTRIPREEVTHISQQVCWLVSVQSTYRSQCHDSCRLLFTDPGSAEKDLT